MKSIIPVFAFFILLVGCKEQPNTKQSAAQVIKHGHLEIAVNDQMKTKISSAFLPNLSDGFTLSEFISTRRHPISGFKLNHFSRKALKDSIGTGWQYEITGINPEKIKKIVFIKAYNNYPDMVFYHVNYVNSGSKKLFITGWTNNHIRINRHPEDNEFWAFQGSSTMERADWISPIGKDYYNPNFLGMNQTDYGGGIPILDVWRQDGGVAIGHTELVPKRVYMNLETSEDGRQADLRINYKYLEPMEFGEGDRLETFETFVAVHQGDCFITQKRFTDYMQQKGLKFAQSEDAAYEPIWCAWGYERGFTLDEIIGTLPKVKDMGFKWAVLDDGYQITEGDWHVNKQKFPNGDAQMKQLVDKIHSYGLKAKLWWAPLAVDYRSETLQKYPDILLKNEDESPQFITWWDAFYMSPSAQETQKHTEEVLDLFINKWGFDGLKMDGQHMNACPPDYANSPDNPEETVEVLPDFFKNTYDFVRKQKPHAVIENCPCGCCMSYYNMPYINQAVSSDPLSSWQIRTKGKVYKALIGKTAYYGDHVELSDNGNDFASSFGVGAVLGSKFTWPKDNPTAEASYLLTPQKEAMMKKWILLYNDLMLSKGDYLGTLYDIGFDRPEAHVIQKDGDLFYAFYAKSFSDEIDLRGLDPNKNYQVTDYFHHKKYRDLNAGRHTLKVDFKDFLLLRVHPK